MGIEPRELFTLTCIFHPGWKEDLNAFFIALCKRGKQRGSEHFKVLPSPPPPVFEADG